MSYGTVLWKIYFLKKNIIERSIYIYIYILKNNKLINYELDNNDMVNNIIQKYKDESIILN